MKRKARKSLLHRFVSRFRKNKVLNLCLRLTGKPLAPRKWIFIVGCYNSGTTLLEKILSLHPDISTLNDEGVILTNQLKRPEDFSFNRIWYPVKDKLYLDPLDPRSADIAKTVKLHWSHFYDTKKDLFLEKSISNALRIEFFNKFFSPAYFIYIVRNGYAVAEGIRRKAVPPHGGPITASHYPIDMCARQWVESDVVVREALSGKQMIAISYEDLTDDTVQTMNTVCEFLEIESIPPVELQRTVTVHGKTQSIANMNGESMMNLTNEDILIIEQNANAILRHYNYKAS